MKPKRTIISAILIGCFALNYLPGYADSIPIDVNVEDEDKVHYEIKRPPEKSLEELYQDIFMVMLMPYIDKAVYNYYEKNSEYLPGVDPWQPVILSIERPNGYRTFQFIIKLKVAPYIGAHVSIGEDIITMRVSYKGVKVEQFEHIKDYPIPPWLQTKNKQSKNLTNNVSTNSIQQADWGNLNCQEKEHFLERLIMINYSSKIGEAVDNYYLTQRGFDVEKITDVRLIGPYEYEMRIQISTYIEAHNPPYGVDIITIHFSHLCDGKVVKYEHRDEKCISDSKLSNLNQKVDTKSYSITVPSKWKVRTDGFEAEFYIGDKKVGGIAKYGYLTMGTTMTYNMKNIFKDLLQMY